MRHGRAGFKLGRVTAHRWALFRNLLVALFRHERIMTTEAKAKAVRGLADQMVTLAKRENLPARRQVLSLVPDREVVGRIFDLYANDGLGFKAIARILTADGVGDTLLPRFKDGLFLGVIPRQGYLQTGYFLHKGADAQLRARGLEALRRDIVTAIPELSEAVNGLESMDDVKLLEIRLNRLRRWYTNGLLCIGDAAHAMSPAGGVGINLAVQDAVAAATLLAAPLRDHRVTAKDLAAVQRRREFPTAVIQTLQRFLHAMMARAIDSGKTPAPNKLMRVLARFPQLSAIPAYLMGVGVRPEHAPEFARRAPQPVSTGLNEKD